MDNFFTNNPERDAERASVDTRDYMLCPNCGSIIYRGDGMYYGDYYYDVDGDIYCEECFPLVAKELWRKEYR